MDQNNHEDIDLSGTLKNSGTDVKFEDNGLRTTGNFSRTNTSKITELVMKFSGGLIKNEGQASYVLAALSVVVIIFSLFLLFGGEGGLKLPSQEQIFRDTPPPISNFR